jgi:hypothetical protein
MPKPKDDLKERMLFQLLNTKFRRAEACLRLRFMLRLLALHQA